MEKILKIGMMFVVLTQFATVAMLGTGYVQPTLLSSIVSHLTIGIFALSYLAHM